jgi:hypothetical protein
MMRWVLPFFLGLVLLSLACEKTAESEPNEVEKPCRNPAGLSNPIIPNQLQVGQRNRYVLFKGRNYSSPSEGDFDYLKE